MFKFSQANEVIKSRLELQDTWYHERYPKTHR